MPGAQIRQQRFGNQRLRQKYAAPHLAEFVIVNAQFQGRGEFFHELFGRYLASLETLQQAGVAAHPGGNFGGRDSCRAAEACE